MPRHRLPQPPLCVPMAVHPPASQPQTRESPPSLDAEITRVFALQQAFKHRLRHTPAEARIARLKNLRAALFERRQALREAVYADFHKPPEEADLTELLPVVVEIDHAMRHLKRWMKPKRVRTPIKLLGTSSRVYYEPKGNGLIISPWNYPVNLTLGPLVGAVAAGCTAILKPSEYTPHAAQFIKALLGELFDEREVALFEGDHTVAQALLKHPFDHIYFTGSPAVGKIIMRAAAEHLTSVTLELGGKSPTIVDETADVAEAAIKIAFGKFANAGQTCIAPDHVYVHERLHDAFVEALRDRIHAFYGADTTAQTATADYARIVNDGHYERLHGLYEEALSQGAHAATGATGRPEIRYLAPTVLTDVPPGTRVMEEEIFGPILPVLPFATLEEVIDAINSRPKPLALYIFSHDNASIDKILHNTTAGGTCINDTLLHFLNPNFPFGGVNTSGIGKGHGHAGFLAFTNERAVLRQHLKHSLFKHFYPPFRKKTHTLIDLLLKYF